MRHFLAAALAVGLSAGVANAGFIDIVSDNANSSNAISEGTFTGRLDLTGNLLTVTLTNTSIAGNGGFITAFVFNGANGANATFNSGLSDAAAQAFVQLSAPVSANPFGDFEIGLALSAKNPSFEGGGSPSDGLAQNETGTFVFNVTDSEPATPLDVMDFFTDAGTDASRDHSGFPFVVRFRGIEGGQGGGSDKVPAMIEEPPVAVPLPPAALAGLFTLGGMGLIRRVRRSLGK